MQRLPRLERLIELARRVPPPALFAGPAVVALVFAAALAAATSDQRGADKVWIGTEPYYEPFTYLVDGELAGFEVDLADELCRRAGLECVWVYEEWTELISSLAAGKYDAVMAALFDAPEWDEAADFTEWYHPPGAAAYAAPPGADPSVISERVAVLDDIAELDYLLATGATVLAYGTEAEAVQAVLDGEADAVFAGKQHLDTTDEIATGMLEYVGDEVIFDAAPAIAVREGDDALRTRFNDAIASMKADGSLNALLREWFGEDGPQFD